MNINHVSMDFFMDKKSKLPPNPDNKSLVCSVVQFVIRNDFIVCNK